MKAISPLLLAAILLSCVTFKADQVKKIKSLAIVSLSVEANDGIGSGLFKIHWEKDAKPVRLGNIVYESTAQKFGQSLGWNVLPLSKVVDNDTYKKLKDKVSYFDIKGTFVIDGLLPGFVGGDERQRLLEALNVDAIVFVTMKVTPGETVGLAARTSRYYRASTQIDMYTGNGQDAAWVDIADGETSDQGVVTWFDIPAVDRTDENKAFLQAISSSLNELGKKMKEKMK